MFEIGIFLPTFNVVVLLVCFASREGVQGERERGRERGQGRMGMFYFCIAAFIKKVTR